MSTGQATGPVAMAGTTHGPTVMQQLAAMTQRSRSSGISMVPLVDLSSFFHLASSWGVSKRTCWFQWRSFLSILEWLVFGFHVRHWCLLRRDGISQHDPTSIIYQLLVEHKRYCALLMQFHSIKALLLWKLAIKALDIRCNQLLYLCKESSRVFCVLTW